MPYVPKADLKTLAELLSKCKEAMPENPELRGRCQSWLDSLSCWHGVKP